MLKIYQIREGLLVEDPLEKHNQSTLRTQQPDDNINIQHLYSRLMRDESSAWDEFYNYFSGRIDYFFRVNCSFP